MPLETLRREYFTEGREQTKVTILHDLSIYHGRDGRGRVTFEYTPDSNWPSPEETDPLYRDMNVPGGSVVEVTVDGKAVPNPIDQSEYARNGWSYHYRFDTWDGSFYLPSGSPTSSDGIRFNSKVVWSRKYVEEDGHYWEGTYILKPTPEVLAMLTKKPSSA